MVSERSAGRPPKGGIAQEISQTAARAHIACRLADRHDEAFLASLGLAVNPTAVERAGSDLTWRSAVYDPPGPKPEAAAATSSSKTARIRAARRAAEPALRDWIEIDYAAMDVSLALVTMSAEKHGEARSLYSALRDIPGVVQAVLFLPDGMKSTVMAVVAWDGEADARRLRGRVEELGAGWSWGPIDVQTVRPAEATWRHLAVVAAQREDLELSRHHRSATDAPSAAGSRTPPLADHADRVDG